MLRKILFSIALAMIPAEAICQQPAPTEFPTFYTGNRLYEACKREDVACTVYVMAATDTLALFDPKGLKACIPSGISARQIILAFQKFAAEHPVMLNNPAAQLVWESLREMFPC